MLWGELNLADEPVASVEPEEPAEPAKVVTAAFVLVRLRDVPCIEPPMSAVVSETAMVSPFTILFIVPLVLLYIVQYIFVESTAIPAGLLNSDARVVTVPPLILTFFTVPLLLFSVQ